MIQENLALQGGQNLASYIELVYLHMLEDCYNVAFLKVK